MRGNGEVLVNVVKSPSDMINKFGDLMFSMVITANLVTLSHILERSKRVDLNVLITRKKTVLCNSKKVVADTMVGIILQLINILINTMHTSNIHSVMN